MEQPPKSTIVRPSRSWSLCSLMVEVCIERSSSGYSGGHCPCTLEHKVCRAARVLVRAARRRTRLHRATARLDESTATRCDSPMDALSELLRAVKISGAMFYNAEGSKPWRIAAPPSRLLGRYVAANASHVIEFHFVTQGTRLHPRRRGDDAVRGRGSAHGAARRPARDGQRDGCGAAGQREGFAVVAARQTRVLATSAAVGKRRTSSAATSRARLG